jgi:hypothetical protein
MRRFGRNQKRALRERIANLEGGIARSANQTSYISKNFDELVKQILFIEREIDANSVLFPAKTMRTDDKSYLPKTRFHEKIPMHFGFAAGADACVLNLKDKFMMNAYIDSGHNIFDSQVHYLLDFGGNRFAYSISEDALASMSKEGLCQRLTENFSIMITNYIKNGTTTQKNRH